MVRLMSGKEELEIAKFYLGIEKTRPNKKLKVSGKLRTYRTGNSCSSDVLVVVEKLAIGSIWHER